MGVAAVVPGAEPVVFLLVGLTGSGKTTYARRRLELGGAVRLSVDERVHARHGRYGVDCPEREYFGLGCPGGRRSPGRTDQAGVRGSLRCAGLRAVDAQGTRRVEEPRSGVRGPESGPGSCISPSRAMSCCGASKHATSARMPTRWPSLPRRWTTSTTGSSRPRARASRSSSPPRSDPRPTSGPPGGDQPCLLSLLNWSGPKPCS